MKKLRKILPILLIVPLLFGLTGMALAEQDSMIDPNAIMAESAVNQGEYIFVDAEGRSEEEVNKIMLAQHPYLLAYQQFVQQCEKAGVYPDYYAGGYFVGTEFVIMMVSQDEKSVDEIQKTFGNNIIIEQAKVSYNDMLTQVGRIKKLISNPDVYVGIDAVNNCVNVEIPKSISEKSSNAIDVLKSEAGVNISIIDSILSPPKTATKREINQYAYYYKSSINLAKQVSHGCWATLADGTLGLVFAGHSAKGDNSGVGVYTSTARTTKIGNVTANAYYDYSYADAGFFETETTSFIPNTATTTNPIKGEYLVELPKNTVVKRIGRLSSSSGKVTAVNKEIKDPDAPYTHTLGVTIAEYTTVTGESGNAVTCGDGMVCGIQGAGNGPSYFSPWYHIKDELEITVVTTP